MVIPEVVTTGTARQPVIVTPALWKVTVPVGETPAVVRVAVRVVSWPATGVVGLELMMRVGRAVLTRSAKLCEVEVANVEV
jgi:hypothetical protein